MRTNGTDENVMRQRIASALGIPLIHMGGRAGQAAAAFERRITQAQAESLANLLGDQVSDLTAAANGPILIELP